MFTKEQKEILQNSINIHGRKLKETIINEEMSELTECFIDELVNGNLTGINEKIADVSICMHMLKMIHNIHYDDIEDYITLKFINSMSRLQKEISKDIRDETRCDFLNQRYADVIVYMIAWKHLNNISDEDIDCWIERKIQRQKMRDEKTLT